MSLMQAPNGTDPSFVTRPLFEQVAEWILARIESGDLSGQLPSETDLARIAKVSLGTVRKALDDLEARGVLDRGTGRGTVVRKPIDISKLPRQARTLIEALGEFNEATRNEIAKAIQARLHELAKSNGAA